MAADELRLDEEGEVSSEGAVESERKDGEQQAGMRDEEQHQRECPAEQRDGPMEHSGIKHRIPCVQQSAGSTSI